MSTHEKLRGPTHGSSIKGEAIKSKGRKGKASVMGSNPLWTNWSLLSFPNPSIKRIPWSHLWRDSVAWHIFGESVAPIFYRKQTTALEFCTRKVGRVSPER